MRFMMLYKSTEAGPAPGPECTAEMGKFVEEGKRSGVLLSTGGLQPSSEGARVRLSSGNFKVIDGPFTESKELVAGFALMQFNSKEEAIESAKSFLKIAGDGECEIRQLYDPADCVPEAYSSADTARA